MKKMLKKCSTDQSLIRKRNTTYKIGTLKLIMKKILNSYCYRYSTTSTILSQWRPNPNPFVVVSNPDSSDFPWILAFGLYLWAWIHENFLYSVLVNNYFVIESQSNLLNPDFLDFPWILAFGLWIDENFSYVI